jgi:LuxR family transcriptional regulator, maltose regulon positive regulatory protein
MASQSVGTSAVTGSPTTGRPRDLPVEILESKLHQPTVRPGVIARPRLLARLRAAREVPTVTVVAPAGYGKTTLLALWAEADDRPFVWLSLDPHDDDPIVLLTHLAVALDRISPLPAGTFDALRSVGVSIPGTVVPRLGAALARFPRPVVLVVDDVHHLQDGPALDALVTLIGHAGGTTQIALAGRGMPAPLARQRAQGHVVDIGVADLAFTEAGARSLLQAAGADLPDDEVVALARRTEGWAAGLYLAALARTGTRPGPPVAVSAGHERLVADYLESETLARLPPRDLSFLTRTAVLERLCGPLCDAVLEASGSTAQLERLERENLFLIPLDGHGRWYRYHPVFRDLLRTRLERDGRAHVRALLRRAADWCETAGQAEAALRYAREGQDVDRVARIAVTLTQPMYAAGRSETLMSWLEWVDERGAVERHPTIAAQAAYICVLTGRPAAADRWADVAERWAGEFSGADGDWPFTMWLATLRGIMCRRGVEQMRRDVDDVEQVSRGGPATDPEYPMRLLLAGVANMLLGDGDTAEARFADATELTDETRRAPLFATILAHRALLSLARGDWSTTETLVQRALSVTHRGHIESYISSTLVFALAARVALHRRDPVLARAHLSEAQRPRPLLSHAIPCLAVEALLEMAEASIGLGDPRGARVFVRDAEAVLRRRPDLGSLGKRTDALRGRLATVHDTGADTATLTSAELRVLPLLLTHLTLAGIADRLFLSRHTVKSQLWSLYRKLDVHTRSDAVIRAQQLGLLDV